MRISCLLSLFMWEPSHLNGAWLDVIVPLLIPTPLRQRHSQERPSLAHLVHFLLHFATVLKMCLESRLCFHLKSNLNCILVKIQIKCLAFSPAVSQAQRVTQTTFLASSGFLVLWTPCTSGASVTVHFPWLPCMQSWLIRWKDGLFRIC